MKPKYTAAVGTKFLEDGTLRTFRGNTVVCMLDKKSPAFKHVLNVQNILNKFTDIDSVYSLLPPDSFHMTMIEGICDEVRQPESWTTKLPLLADLEAVNAFFKEQAVHFPEPQNFQMCFDEMRYKGVMLMYLKPKNQNSANFLKNYRDAFARHTGLRFKDHERYRFHISFAYQLLELESSQERELQQLSREASDYLKASSFEVSDLVPRLSFFNDMGAFPPL